MNQEGSKSKTLIRRSAVDGHEACQPKRGLAAWRVHGPRKSRSPNYAASSSCPSGTSRDPLIGSLMPSIGLSGNAWHTLHQKAVAVVGEVGSGKSTLVAGILGELPAFARPLDNMVTCRRGWGGFRTGGGKTHRLARTVAGVRRETRVCYAAQSPWLMTGTVRDNVLFGLPMDEARYRYLAAAKQCWHSRSLGASDI